MAHAPNAEMGRWPPWFAAAAVAVFASATACDGGTFACGGGCPPGYVCRDDRCVSDAEACEGVRCSEGYVCEGGDCVQRDPCEDITCADPSQVCREGYCVTGDPCDGVICPNPGDVCSGGGCVSGAADEDGDGYAARDDCDDGNRDVHPGAADVCNGVDDDCDEATADGAVDCSGRCCGSPPACRECCAPDQCGAGDWTCEGFACGCAGLVCSGACLLDPDCTPGDRHYDSRDCGTCGGGTQSHTDRCTSSCTWSEGSWSTCSGDVTCTDAFGDTVCPGAEGWRDCTSGAYPGYQLCTCSSSGVLTSCDHCLLE